MHGRPFSQEKSIIFRQFACATGCVQCFMLAQQCGIRISEFWRKFTFLLDQQIKLVLISLYYNHQLNNSADVDIMRLSSNELTNVLLIVILSLLF